MDYFWSHNQAGPGVNVVFFDLINALSSGCQNTRLHNQV